MIVKKIFWVEPAVKEAELVISDGIYECIAFSQPCNLTIGEILSKPLEAFITENLMISDETNCRFKRDDLDAFSYNCIANVSDVENNIVKVGEIFISLDAKLPQGCKLDSIVEFSCARLDAFS